MWIVSWCWAWCSAIENFQQCLLVFYDVDYHNSIHVIQQLMHIFKFLILWCPLYSNPLKYFTHAQELMHISICRAWGILKNPYPEFQLLLRRFTGALSWTSMQHQSLAVIKILVTQLMELLNKAIQFVQDMNCCQFWS